MSKRLCKNKCIITEEFICCYDCEKFKECTDQCEYIQLDSLKYKKCPEKV
jgi:hypothetical protein